MQLEKQPENLSPEDRQARARAVELETYNQQLKARDNLLRCVNLATRHLVAIEDLTKALKGVLRIIGVGTQQCRCYILKNIWNANTQQKEFDLYLEWDAPGYPTKVEAGGQFPVAINHFPDHLTEPLKAGEATQFLARDLDGVGARDRIDGQALSLLGVPITVNGEWWGLLGLDDCVNERVWSDAEIAVLMTAASAISSAITRTQAREAKIQAEIAISAEREQVSKENAKLLSSVAQAANLLLKAADYRSVLPNVAELLGKVVNCDRCTIARIVDQRIEQDAGYIKLQLLQEWRKPGTAPLPVHPHQEATTALEENLPTFCRRLTRGEVINCLTPIVKTECQQECQDDTTQAHRLSSEVIVPIVIQGRCWGEISFNNCASTRPYTDAETAILQIASESISAAISRQAQNELLTEERTRLAREIHDTLAQAFTGISLQLEAARAMLCNEEAAPTDEKLEAAQDSLLRARDLARKGLSEARRSVHALRSEALETDTLAGALRKLLLQTQRDTGLDTQFSIEGAIAIISDEIQLNLLRIAQEATTNTLRHAQATRLSITLRFVPHTSQHHPSTVQLLITDNGTGFEPATLGLDSRFGILGIQERTARLKGDLDLRSSPATGTTLLVTVPIAR